jgi:hypothetical protein
MPEAGSIATHLGRSVVREGKKLMKISVKSGSAIAAAAASLLMAGAIIAPTTQAVADAKGQCVGANACKGQSACKTATSSCKGQNACKGKGFLEMTKAECEKIEGANYIEAAPKG